MGSPRTQILHPLRGEPSGSRTDLQKKPESFADP